MQKSGRKIIRSKGLYSNKRRRKSKSVIKIVIMLVFVVGLVFLGYSVGEPIINFFKDNVGKSNSSSEPWSPSDVISSSSEVIDSSSKESSSESSSSSGNVDLNNFSAFELTVESLKNEAGLTSAIDVAKLQGYTAIVVTLKSEGGAINYKSNVELANKATVITSELTSTRIAEIIKKSGLVAVARVNTLNDNVTPKADKKAGYTFENSASSWLDNAEASGGKPWLNPFSETTKKYFTDISTEVCLAGFDEVICSDVIFPAFRTTDLNYIGATVKDANRYSALINVVDTFKNNAMNTSTSIGVEVSAKGVIDGTAEVFKPEMLEGITAVIDYDVTEIGNKFVVGDKETILTGLSVYDKVKTIFENVKAKSGSLKIIPCISQEGMNVGDVSEAIRAVVDLGYSSYIIK